jgi:hypothetical protein
MSNPTADINDTAAGASAPRGTIHIVLHEAKDTVGVAVVEGIKAGMQLNAWIMDDDEIVTVPAKQDIPIGHRVAVALTATLSTHNVIPVAGITLILGVDRVLNEIRALTNMIGNVVATLVVARWEHAFDARAAREFLAAPREAQAQASAQPVRKARTAQAEQAREEEPRLPRAEALFEKAAK